MPYSNIYGFADNLSSDNNAELYAVQIVVNNCEDYDDKSKEYKDKLSLYPNIYPHHLTANYTDWVLNNPANVMVQRLF